MLIFNATKRFNKALAPKLLKWSLRLHESLSSSPTASSLLPPNAISFLPIAQRLVSIEVQDDYQQLLRTDGKNNSISSGWDNFVDNAWNVFFEDRHQKLKAEQDDQKVEAEVERLLEAKRLKRQQKRQRKRTTAKTYEKKQNNDVDQEEIHQMSNERVHIFEKYIRPALLPTSSMVDYNRHLFTHHYQQNQQQSTHYDNFTKWIRGEYLIAKYGLAVSKAVKNHPELRDDAAGLSTFEAETEDVPLILPSVNTVREAFIMKGWSRKKLPMSTWDEEDDEGDQYFISTSRAGDTNETPTTSIDRIIHHKLHGQIANSGPLNAYFEMRKREDSYELWTREYIFGLAQYLLDRIATMDDGHDETETIILDVGAGDGRLVYFLRRAMKEISSRQKSKSSKRKEIVQHTKLPTIIASDDGSWKAPRYDDHNQHIQVEQLSAVDALAKYGPKLNEQVEEDDTKNTRLIVLCSWMPPGVDWTADFRQLIGGKEGDDEEDDSSIKRLAEEYILIGETDDGTCGHNWYTWGNPDFHPEFNHDASHTGKEQLTPPYELDGYERVDLEKLSLFQFSRFDCKRSSESRTVSFRRGG